MTEAQDKSNKSISDSDFDSKSKPKPGEKPSEDQMEKTFVHHGKAWYAQPEYLDRSIQNNPLVPGKILDSISITIFDDLNGKTYKASMYWEPTQKTGVSIASVTVYQNSWPIFMLDPMLYGIMLANSLDSIDPYAFADKLEVGGYVDNTPLVPPTKDHDDAGGGIEPVDDSVLDIWEEALPDAPFSHDEDDDNISGDDDNGLWGDFGDGGGTLQPL